MKIGVVSDSHKNLDFLNQAICACQKEGIKFIIHLGDDYDDIENIEGISVIKIPGVFDSQYQDKSIPHRLVLEFSGIRILITHSPTSHEKDFPTDLEPEVLAKRESVKLILFGHIHIPSIEEKENILWVNPGHLKIEDKKGYPASFAVIDIKANKLNVKIIDLLNNNIIFSKEKIF